MYSRYEFYHTTIWGYFLLAQTLILLLQMNDTLIACISSWRWYNSNIEFNDSTQQNLKYLFIIAIFFPISVVLCRKGVIDVSTNIIYLFARSRDAWPNYVLDLINCELFTLYFKRILYKHLQFVWRMIWNQDYYASAKYFLHRLYKYFKTLFLINSIKPVVNGNSQ